MFHRPIKTLVFTITALFVAAPLVLAADSLSNPDPKTMQDVGAIQGQNDVVTHGPKPTELSTESGVKAPASPRSEAPPKTMQDVGAIQGQNDVVTHGPKPSSSR